MSPGFAGCHGPVDRRQRMACQRCLIAAGFDSSLPMWLYPPANKTKGGVGEMRAFLAVLVFGVFASGAVAQQSNSPGARMLTPAECSLITKGSQGDFIVKGPVMIGGIKFENQSIPPHGVRINGIDSFDVIQRSCFNGRPT
jgi:hypothetical protein